MISLYFVLFSKDIPFVSNQHLGPDTDCPEQKQAAPDGLLNKISEVVMLFLILSANLILCCGSLSFHLSANLLSGFNSLPLRRTKPSLVKIP